MKKLAILLINGYQKFLSSFMLQVVGVAHACRFTPTCSEYSKNVIARRGLIFGGYLSIIRILKCQPFYNPKGARA